MTPRTITGWLSLLTTLFLCAAPPLLAADMSPRRQAEISALIARRHAERTAQARCARLREYEIACELREARTHELAMAQSFAAAQTALAQQQLQAGLTAWRGPVTWAGATGTPFATGVGACSVNVPIHAEPHHIQGSETAHAGSHEHSHHGH